MCKKICSSNYNKDTDCNNLKLLRSLSGRQQQGFTVSAGRQTNSINITNIYIHLLLLIDHLGGGLLRGNPILGMGYSETWLSTNIKHLNTSRVYKTKQAIVQSFKYCSL